MECNGPIDVVTQDSLIPAARAISQSSKSSRRLQKGAMLHLSDRDDNAFCGAKDGGRTF